MSAHDDDKAGKQVSEVSGLGSADAADDPIEPSDATAGYPTDLDSQRPQEGTAGPDAPPKHGRPRVGDQASED